MAINRVVRPELLDSLNPGDPDAMRSRRDLRAINGLMGNFRWVKGALARFPKIVDSGVVEIGAGEGGLCEMLAEAWSVPITGLDLMPRPASLPNHVGWRQGDVFQTLPMVSGGVAVSVMFLHHFDDDGLAVFGRMFSKFDMLCICEPFRSRWSHGLGWVMDPFVGSVTRHDMHTSIDAGFLPGELARGLGLAGWKIQESIDWRGGVRLLALRS